MPAPASSSAAGPSRLATASSSSSRTDGLACSSSGASGGHTAAPRRSASSRSVSACAPNLASTRSGWSHSAAASTIRLGSAVLRSCSTSRNAGTASSRLARAGSCGAGGRASGVLVVPLAGRAVVAAGRPRSEGPGVRLRTGRRWCRPATPPDRRPGSARPRRTPVTATVRGAAALRTRVSAIASQNARISDSGERSRIGREPGTARACAAGRERGSKLASQARSAGSSGPARQASAPPAVTVGSSRPRATRPTPAVAAADHTPTDRRTGASGRPAAFGSMASSVGRASATGTRSAETRRLRIPYLPPAKTSSTLPDPEPVPQSANTPRRGIRSGTKTASPSSTGPHDTGQAGGLRAGLA